MSTVKIDNNMPNRISMNVSVGRQSQGATFGEKVNAGLQNGASALASGASLIGGAIPGANLISAAVSGVGRLTGGAPGSSAAAASYSMVGVAGGATNMSTTVTGSGNSTITTGSGGTGVNLTGGASNDTTGMMNQGLLDMQKSNNEMLAVQMKLQAENTQFSSVSNALKTKHDTVKNSVSNLR